MKWIAFLLRSRKLLGIGEFCDSFDTDVMIHINSAFATLQQLGVGPPGGFAITGNAEVWNDFLPESVKLESVKTYVYLKVKLVFDPPLTSSVLEAMKEQISEYEWRFTVAVDSMVKGETSNG